MSNTLMQQYGPWALIAGGSEDIGLLIYNAGAIHGAGLFLDEPLERTRKLIGLNCTGPAIFCHHLGNAMRQRGRGGILLMSSLSGLTGGAYIAAYAGYQDFRYRTGGEPVGGTGTLRCSCPRPGRGRHRHTLHECIGITL